MLEHLLVVDDDHMIRSLLKASFDAMGVNVSCASSGEDALEVLKKSHDVDVCFCDLKMGRVTGLDVLKIAKETVPDMIVVMMTARDDQELVDEALSAGAMTVLIKPFTLAQIHASVATAKRLLGLTRQNAHLRKAAKPCLSASVLDDDRIQGNSYQIMRVVQLCRRAADSPHPTMITGEAGVGKTLAADEICRLIDPDYAQPKIWFDCIPSAHMDVETALFGQHAVSKTGANTREIGQLELADNGILVLENVDRLPNQAQEKIADFLKTGHVRRVNGQTSFPLHTRLIATSRLSLKRQVQLDRFSSTLYQQLQRMAIHLPPLRERGNDVIVIARKFLKRLCARNGKQLTLSGQALDRMQVYQWPGNFSELAGLIEQLALVSKGPVITAEELPPHILDEKPVHIAIPETDVNRMFNIREIERFTVIRALKETKGNRCKAAELLGFTPRTLRNKLAEYDEAGVWDENFDPKKKKRRER